MNRYYYFPSNQPMYPGTMVPPFGQPRYSSNNFFPTPTTVFNNEDSPPETTTMLLQYNNQQQICNNNNINTDAPSPSVLQTLLKKDAHHSTMQMDVAPSTSNISISMLNGSRGGVGPPNFVAIKNEPTSVGHNVAAISFNGVGGMAVKNEPSLNSPYGNGGVGVKTCAKYDPDSPSSLIGCNGADLDQKPYICAGCNNRITDRFLLNAADKMWHESCLRCCECRCQLTEKNRSLFVKNNNIYCREDYGRLFGVKGKCSACHNIIPPLEMIMRAGGNVYHLDCFACQECNHRFCVGDTFFFDFDNNKILCENDYNERMYFAKLSNCNSPLYLAQLKQRISYQVEELDEIPTMHR